MDSTEIRWHHLANLERSHRVARALTICMSFQKPMSLQYIRYCRCFCSGSSETGPEASQRHLPNPGLTWDGTGTPDAIHGSDRQRLIDHKRFGRRLLSCAPCPRKDEPRRDGLILLDARWRHCKDCYFGFGPC